MSEYLDEVTMVIINDLKAGKLKLDLFESKLKWYRQLYIVVALFFLAYIALFIVYPYWSDQSLLYKEFIGNKWNYVFVAIIVTIHFYIKNLKKITDGIEKDYEMLRCEVVQRFDDLWSEEIGQEKRYLFLKEMKERYHINLYYESTN